LARAFRGRPGLLIRSLLAEAQFDPELKRALYGGLYYRLLMGTGSLSDAYRIWLLEQFRTVRVKLGIRQLHETTICPKLRNPIKRQISFF
jgi:hypothetical protein